MHTISMNLVVCLCVQQLTVGGSTLVYRGLEAANVFHGHAVTVSGFQVLVESGKYLRVEDLELSYSVYHLLQSLRSVMLCNMIYAI